MAKSKKPKVRMINDKQVPAAPKNIFKVASGGLTRGCTRITDTRTTAPVVPAEPTILYSPEVQQKMTYIVEQCKKEVGWMCLVDKLDEETYYIYDVFVPKQEVSAVETDIESEAMADLAMEIMDAGGDIEDMYGWFHSHVNMGVSPSGQDETQVEEFLESCPVFIRGIINKRGESKIDVYYRDHGICYTNVPTEVYIPELSKELKKEIDATLKANVTEVVYQTQTYTGGYYQQGVWKANQNNQFHQKKDNTPHRIGNVTQPSNQLALSQLDYDFDDDLDIQAAMEASATADENRDIPNLGAEVYSTDPDDTGFGLEWTMETPKEERPSGWSLDPFFQDQINKLGHGHA